MDELIEFLKNEIKDYNSLGYEEIDEEKEEPWSGRNIYDSWQNGHAQGGFDMLIKITRELERWASDD